MVRISFALGVLLVTLSSIVTAQDGKLRGRVIDKQTREPLISANVTIEGTSLGATTDVNGDYIVLSVPPAVYTIRATYIGYATVTISNIRILSNSTTTQDYELSSSAIQVEAVEVVAERPLIQRNTTNTVRLMTQENLERLPFRGVESLLALQAGVVRQDDKLYIRGGRAGEVAYFVEGANVTNPFNNSENVDVIQEAVEEIQLQSGGFTAEYGGANSGVVRTTMRSGGTDLRITLDYQTDDFSKPGNQFLGTSSFGFRNVVGTVGGPIPEVPNAKFFIVGQHRYTRNRQQMYLEPFRFEDLKTDGFSGRPAGVLLPNNGTVEFKRNFLYNNWEENNTLQGTLSYDLSPLKFRLSGSYSRERAPRGGQWPSALENYFNQGRNTLDKTDSRFVNLRVTHVLGLSTFYEVGVSFTDRLNRTVDPSFGHSWQLYMDSTANAQKGFTGFLRRYSGPLQWSTINGFRFEDPNTPNNTYSKEKQAAFGMNVDLTSQVSPNWEMKAGGRLDRWVVRGYSVGSIEAVLVYLNGLYGTTPRSFASDYERRVLLERAGTINHYGYDVDGNESDDEFQRARVPLFSSAYIQNKFEFRDIILNIGLRYEYYATDILVPLDPSAGSGFDQTLDFIDESKLVEKDPFSYVLPRISFSFPATDKTVFYAQFGKYAQLPELSRLYMGNYILSRNISPFTRSPWGRAGGAPPSFAIVPERTTQYEIGLRQWLTDNFAFTISGFYKHVADQLQYSKYPSVDNPLYVSLKNEDFATMKGLEMTFELQRTNRLSARMNYTLSDARGTASDAAEWYAPVSDITINSRFPQFVNPLQFNQTHRGSILLDYRFTRDEGGPVFSGAGMNFVLSFNSGHHYTKTASEFGAASSPWVVGIPSESRRRPSEPINGSTTPWVFNIDLNLNKAFYFEGILAELYINMLNVLNTKQVLNFYETTGTAQDDGWLSSSQSSAYREIPMYSDFYRAINLDNRYAYIQRKGRDLFGSPRQIRVGVKLEVTP